MDSNSSENTPLFLKKISSNTNLFYYADVNNPTGSIKDRSAKYLLEKMEFAPDRLSGKTLIESSSGNFGLALAWYCHQKSFPFEVIIDSRCNKILKDKMAQLCKVNNIGHTLNDRLEYLKRRLQSDPSLLWTNQYDNPLIPEAYEKTLAPTIFDNTNPSWEYIFVAVSTGGTLKGLTDYAKKKGLKTRFIAVDIEGSLVYGKTQAQRHFPGIGAPFRGSFFSKEIADGFVITSQKDIVTGCSDLKTSHGLNFGASSGAVFHAAHQFFTKCPSLKGPALLLMADRGEPYSETLYNQEWIRNNIHQTMTDNSGDNIEIFF